ncbi:MAG: class I SAM-dependent methyltransferase [Bdellovibrionota bacterium]
MASLALWFLFVILLSFAYAAWAGAPWVPTWRRDIERIRKLIDMKPGEIFYELGCGDGRVTLAIGQKPRAVGVELSIAQWIVAQVRRVLKRSWHVHFALANAFRVDLKPADAVYLFLMPETYTKIASKLECELRPGTRVVSYVWPIPGWTPERVDRLEGAPDLYLYIISRPLSGA